MGREIRRVPPNWQHPCYTKDNAPSTDRIGEMKPCHDQDYEMAALEWTANFDVWRKGEHEEQPCDYCRFYWEHDTPPNEDSYRPAFAEAPTWFQVYETVSEGTPTTPPFATTEELIDHLTTAGESLLDPQYHKPYARETAEKFVKGGGYVPSMIVSEGKIYEGISAVNAFKEK